MRFKIAFVLMLLLVATFAYAQSPFPGGVQLHSGGWVPCTHPLAIAEGKGCATPTQSTGIVKSTVATQIQVGKYYRNTNNNCLIRTLAIAVTHLHREPVIIAERVDPGAVAGFPEESWGCPEVAYFFRLNWPPDGNWHEVEPESIGVDW